jgi:hypothetical protein
VPQPRWSDLRRFCDIDGWEERGRTRGGTGDHFRYRKLLPDGRILRTKASHGNDEIGDPGLWHHILRNQLELETEEQFWEALRAGQPVPRGAAEPGPPGSPSIPTWVVSGLLRAGVAEADIRGMSAEEAQRRLEELWSQPPEPRS